MDEPEKIFDSQRLALARTRARERFDQHKIIHDKAASGIIERLKDTTHDYKEIAVVGSLGSTPLIQGLKELYPMASITLFDPAPDNSEEDINIVKTSLEDPFDQSEQYDLIINFMTLQQVNNLPYLLFKSNVALKHDGFFIAVMLGEESLIEMRHILMTVDLEMYGGATQRAAPMIALRDATALLQQAGFAMPAGDYDRYRLTYSSFEKLVHDLRGMGLGNSLVQTKKQPLNKNYLEHVNQLYKEQYAPDENSDRIEATFDLIYGVGWRPDPSQAQPKQPGSATHSLAQALNTEEISTTALAKPAEPLAQSQNDQDGQA